MSFSLTSRKGKTTSARKNFSLTFFVSCAYHMASNLEIDMEKTDIKGEETIIGGGTEA